LTIAAAKRLRLRCHDPPPAAIERTTDTVAALMLHPSIPLRCIEATLAASANHCARRDINCFAERRIHDRLGAEFGQKSTSAECSEKLIAKNSVQQA